MRPFVLHGEFTILPNPVIEDLMPVISCNALRVLLFVLRKTVGWQKKLDYLALSQLREGTGIKTDFTVLKAVTELEELGVLHVHRGKDWHNGRQETNGYSLNFDWEMEPTSKTEDGKKPTSIFEETERNSSKNSNSSSLTSLNSKCNYELPFEEFDFSNDLTGGDFE